MTLPFQARIGSHGASGLPSFVRISSPFPSRLNGQPGKLNGQPGRGTRSAECPRPVPVRAGRGRSEGGNPRVDLPRSRRQSRRSPHGPISRLRALVGSRSRDTRQGPFRSLPETRSTRGRWPRGAGQSGALRSPYTCRLGRTIKFECGAGSSVSVRECHLKECGRPRRRGPRKPTRRSSRPTD